MARARIDGYAQRVRAVYRTRPALRQQHWAPGAAFPWSTSSCTLTLTLGGALTRTLALALASTQVLLDLHGAPGGQTVNQDTGCATACEGDGCGKASHYFTRPRNVATAVTAVTRLAQMCVAAGPTCYGIELLNEPTPYIVGEGASDRAALLHYYQLAIAAVRGAGGLDAAVPIVLMDWPQFLASYWLRNARALAALPGAGTLVWESHIYAGVSTSTLLELKALAPTPPTSPF